MHKYLLYKCPEATTQITMPEVSTMQRGLKAEFFYGLKPSHASCLLPDVSMRLGTQKRFRV